MDPSADLLHSVRLENNSCVRYCRCGMKAVYRSSREVTYIWEHIILCPLSGGIRRGVYVADVFVVRCWNVVASVLAASSCN